MLLSVKTTIDLPDALHRRARLWAVEKGITLRDRIVSALTRSLRGEEFEAPMPADREAHFTLDEEGWPVLNRTEGEAAVSDTAVQQLRE